MAVKKTHKNKWGLRHTHIKIKDDRVPFQVNQLLHGLIEPEYGSERGHANKEIADRYEAVMRTVFGYIKAIEEFHYQNNKAFKWRKK